jgi:hypothetical protein
MSSKLLRFLHFSTPLGKFEPKLETGEICRKKLQTTPAAHFRNQACSTPRCGSGSAWENFNKVINKLKNRLSAVFNNPLNMRNTSMCTR